MNLEPGDAAEPAIAIGPDGTVAITAGAYEHATWEGFHTKLWIGASGGVEYGGAVGAFEHPTHRAIPSRDSDVEVSSTGTLHATTNVRLYPPSLETPTGDPPPAWAISAIRCPGVQSPDFDSSDCSSQLIDEAPAVDSVGLDRPWILAVGSDVWIAYHAPSLIRVQHSRDDGQTWELAGTLVPTDGTSDGELENTQGPMAIDPSTGDLVMTYVTNRTGEQTLVVARSQDDGATWKRTPVYAGPLGERLASFFPTIAIDPETAVWHVAWSTGSKVLALRSMDGSNWSDPQVVSTDPASVGRFPWIAAAGGVVDIVYYGTSASAAAPDSPWHVFVAQSLDEGLTYRQKIVNREPNHVGRVCMEGAQCDDANRLLLDLFEVAIDRTTGNALIVYTDTTLATTDGGDPLPQVVLAVEP